MTQVDLLPRELRERQRARAFTMAVGVGVLLVFFIFALMYLLQVGRLSEAEEDLSAQSTANAKLERQIQGLGQYEQLKQAVSEREALAAEMLRGHVLWSGVLRDISRVIPADMWLTSMSGSLAGATAGTTDPSQPPPPPTGSAPSSTTVAAAPGSGVVGSIQFEGVAFEQPTVASWLRRLEEVTGWVNSWVMSSSKDEATSGGAQVHFTGSVDLTVQATVDRGTR